MNGDETDEDCGGATCDPCLAGEGCTDVDGTDNDENCEASAYCESGECTYAVSCLDLLTRRPATLSFRYTIDTDGPGDGTIEPCEVYCDMDTDGGGWTRVGASRGSPLSDKDSTCYVGLRQETPGASAEGVWNGMRALITAASPNSDIRFSCKRDPADASFEVDMVFRACEWYRVITTGTDTFSCFSEWGSPLAAPARENLITGDTLPAGDWSLPLAGEATCADLDSFVVDIDGPGLDTFDPPGSSEDDLLSLTSWGEAHSEKQCGINPVSSGAWYLWVRESP
jgi:hypothetical protein